MKIFLFYFALTGLLSALVVHLLSVADIDLTEQMPLVWMLHIGIFIVWLPVILELKNNQALQDYHRSDRSQKNPVRFFRILFKDTPPWLIILILASYVYAIVNFMLFMASQEGSPGIKEGQYVLQNHGQLIKTLTEQEYHHYKANEVRGFSGHWLLFYGIATVVLYKHRQQPQPGAQSRP